MLAKKCSILFPEKQNKILCLVLKKVCRLARTSCRQVLGVQYFKELIQLYQQLHLLCKYT